ncbi:MAG TPA: YlxM family DNA-binding protein [Clostridia bacterium]
MEKVYEISLLIDFYGQLLTKRQYEVLDLHYNNDFSLSEIAEQLGISRQGVFDNLKRGKSILDDLEQKLGLVKKFSEQKVKAQSILEAVNSISRDVLSDKDKDNLEKIKNIVDEIING